MASSSWRKHDTAEEELLRNLGMGQRVMIIMVSWRWWCADPWFTPLIPHTSLGCLPWSLSYRWAHQGPERYALACPPWLMVGDSDSSPGWVQGRTFGQISGFWMQIPGGLRSTWLSGTHFLACPWNGALSGVWSNRARLWVGVTHSKDSGPVRHVTGVNSLSPLMNWRNHHLFPLRDDGTFI